MMLILPNEEAIAFLTMLRELTQRLDSMGLKVTEQSRHLRVIKGVGDSATRHGGGLFSFSIDASYLFDIKQILMKHGFSHSSIRRAALVRIDESLGLYYRSLRASRSTKNR